MSRHVREGKVLVTDELDLGDVDQTEVLLANEGSVLDGFLADIVDVLFETKSQSELCTYVAVKFERTVCSQMIPTYPE